MTASSPQGIAPSNNAEPAPNPDLPFSPALDELIAEIRKGRAPNLGSFCGNCCAPLLAQDPRCTTCGSAVRDVPPRERISRALAAIYTHKRSREGRMVHAAAWFGIMLGVAISTVLIIVLPDWTKVFAILFLILGSYYIASYLGNVLIQDYAYRQGLRAFARAWARYRLDREQGLLDDD